MPLQIAPPTADFEAAGEWTNPQSAAWIAANPRPLPVAGVGAFRHLTSRPVLGWLVRMWAHHLTLAWRVLPDAWRYGFWGAALWDLAVCLAFPLTVVPFFAAVVCFDRFASDSWKVRFWTWRYRRDMYEANRRAWLRQRPRRAEVAAWHLALLQSRTVPGPEDGEQSALPEEPRRPAPTHTVRQTLRYWLALGKLFRCAVVWWWGERPDLSKLHHALLAAVREQEARVAAEQAAAVAEAERLRAERLDYVLRWMFGADVMTPDDIGPHHLAN